MKIEVNMEELRKHRLFIATPMYGGQCSGIYCQSLAELTATCATHRIGLKLSFLFQESLITRARNYLVDDFLQSNCTHFMFIDSDIGFSAESVLTLLALQTDQSPYDVLAASYPRKHIAWDRVKEAVNKGCEAKELANFTADHFFSTVHQTVRYDEPTEVTEIGTGFMMIRRATFEKYAGTYPQYLYKPDHPSSVDFSKNNALDGAHEITTFFDCVIDPITKRYLSEDYFFCQNVRRMGSKVWMCPWISLQHIGSYTYK